MGLLQGPKRHLGYWSQYEIFTLQCEEIVKYLKYLCLSVLAALCIIATRIAIHAYSYVAIPPLHR